MLWVVGLGPGDPAWITPEVSEVLVHATHVMGYAGYLARLTPREGQVFLASGNAVELARAQQALALAGAGQKVVLVSGGDPGIFAMAAAVFEAIELGPPAWRGIDVKVCPGISALQAAAARAGAPIGHDFCGISLSDNLKPWELIARRLKAACEGDFVIALYNPASAARPRQIFEAFALFRELKAAHTIVIFAKSVGRQDEKIIISTLAAADPGIADMSTLVIIGSSQTKNVSRETFGLPPYIYTSRTAKAD
jgi:precorrin-3B C17-methyltransferase